MRARILLITLCLGLLGAPAMAEGWRSLIASHPFGPPRVLAVDKEHQTFFLLTRESPLQVAAEYPCTTGQLEGDKQVQGDLRTPEGVYFITGRIHRDLDFELYGDAAYGLNYPNPVDRLRGKTGSGIWIHGRGRELVMRDTRGCVALANEDILSLTDRLTPGLPVIIGQSVAWTQEGGDQEPLARDLVAQVRAWASAWSGRSEAFFDFYDPELFARTSGASFAAFAEHKRSIFASQPWIDVMVANVHAMAGPDYWVTWFDQYYRTPGMTSVVGKRFYWQRGDDGVWRIVGREYAPANDGVERLYLEERGQDARRLVDAWRQAWLGRDVEGYSALYGENADIGSARGREAIAAYKAGIWAERAPVRVDVDDLDVSLHPAGLAVRFVQYYEDDSGYSDTGRKVLVLAPVGDGWRIVSETWTRIQ